MVDLVKLIHRESLGSFNVASLRVGEHEYGIVEGVMRGLGVTLGDVGRA